MSSEVHRAVNDTTPTQAICTPTTGYRRWINTLEKQEREKKTGGGMRKWGGAGERGKRQAKKEGQKLSKSVLGD